ncbi:hypothetical protein ACRALDRAFT_2020042 [Sodiomyces alcalophilus JCM 7366]|uniref:uncharacterized protein n=1 Tax=Sodiomyces alcalophilus JCM 7366 TaxID=591952 RepID=UPI0039B3DF35
MHHNWYAWQDELEVNDEQRRKAIRTIEYLMSRRGKRCKQQVSHALRNIGSVSGGAACKCSIRNTHKNQEGPMAQRQRVRFQHLEIPEGYPPFFFVFFSSFTCFFVFHFSFFTSVSHLSLTSTTTEPITTPEVLRLVSGHGIIHHSKLFETTTNLAVNHISGHHDNRLHYTSPQSTDYPTTGNESNVRAAPLLMTDPPRNPLGAWQALSSLVRSSPIGQLSCPTSCRSQNSTAQCRDGTADAAKPIGSIGSISSRPGCPAAWLFAIMALSGSTPRQLDNQSPASSSSGMPRGPSSGGFGIGLPPGLPLHPHKRVVQCSQCLVSGHLLNPSSCHTFHLIPVFCPTLASKGRRTIFLTAFPHVTDTPAPVPSSLFPILFFSVTIFLFLSPLPSLVPVSLYFYFILFSFFLDAFLGDIGGVDAGSAPALVDASPPLGPPLALFDSAFLSDPVVIPPWNCMTCSSLLFLTNLLSLPRARAVLNLPVSPVSSRVLDPSKIKAAHLIIMSSHDSTAAAPPPPVRPKSQRRFLLVNKRPSSSSSSFSSRTRDSSPPSRPPPRPSPLSIRATVKFKAPLDHVYENTYETSPFFDPTDHFCQTLLRRLDHGCTELITRRDSTALDNRSGEKTLRFEMTFVIRHAGKLWSTRSYRSYQRLFLDRHSASDVTEATDRIIGSFLKRHDQNFKWHALEPVSFEPDPAMLSIPLARFLVSKQDYEHVPGYEITFTFNSRCKSRGEPLWERHIAARSRQGTPLTLALAEELSWNLSQAIHDALDRRKQALDQDHRSSCDPTLDGDACGHLDERSLNVAFRIQNHLGVDISHLHRSITTKLALFRHPEGLDCQQFTDHLEKGILHLRDHADDALGRYDDLRIAVRQLSGTGWETKDPFSLSVDSSICYPRRTIQAVLDRLQSGIGDVFRNRNVTMTLTAVKRGHIVLDKTLVARSFRRQTMDDPQSEEDTLLSMLKDRMQSDVAMVIRDTGSLADVGESPPPNLRLIDRASPVLPEVLPQPLAAAPLAGSRDEEEGVPTTTRVSELDGNPLSAPRPSEPQTVEELDAAEPERRHEGPDLMTLADRHKGLPATPPRRLSYAASSFALTNGGGESITPSTRPATPSLCGNELETPMDSLILTPSPHRMLDHFAMRKDVDDHFARPESIGDESIPTLASVKPMKEPRRFSLLSRDSRPSTPASIAILPEANAAVEPAAGQGHGETALTDAGSLEGWLDFVCEPLECEEPPSAGLASRNAGMRDSGVVVEDEPAPAAALELAGCMDACVGAVKGGRGGCDTVDDGSNVGLETVGPEAVEAETGNMEVRPETTEPARERSEQVEPEEVEPTQLEPNEAKLEKIGVQIVKEETIKVKETWPETVEPGKVETERAEAEAAEPEGGEPATIEPVTVKEETVLLEAAGPERDEPATIEEESALPETVKVEEVWPETVEPEKVETEKVEAEKAEAEAVEPATAEEETALPEASEPERHEPATAEEETALPEASEPERHEPATAEEETANPAKAETENAVTETVEPGNLELEAGVETAEVEKVEPDTKLETIEPHPVESEETEPDEKLPERIDFVETDGALQSWRAMAPFDDPPADETPEPNTPAMTIGSESSETSPSQSLTPVQPGSQLPTRIVGTLSAASLTLRSQSWSPFISGDGDFDTYLDETPSKPGRKRVNSHANPFTLSIPTYLPAPSHASLELPLPIRSRRDRPREPHIHHKRQFSVPTAGFVGLLQHPDSPLRLQSYCAYRQWDHLRHQRQTSLQADVDGGAGEASSEGERRRNETGPARLLLGYGPEKMGVRSSPDVVRPSRPRVMSAEGIVADARRRARSGSGSGVRSRSGSMLGAAIWNFTNSFSPGYGGFKKLEQGAAYQIDWAQRDGCEASRLKTGDIEPDGGRGGSKRLETAEMQIMNMALLLNTKYRYNCP